MRKLADFIIWSNFAFLAPLFWAISKNLYFYALLIFAVFVFSILFHLYEERKFKFLDSLFAWLLIGANLYTFYVKGLNSLYFITALVFVAIGLYFRPKKHSLWHIASAIITMLALA